MSASHETDIASATWNMTNDDARNVDRAWDLMKKIGFATNT
jgi:hypothetical protein